MFYRSLCFCLCALSFTISTLSQPLVKTSFPPSVPLANRSPYFNAWQLSSSNAPTLTQSWPTFWTSQTGLGWVGRIRIDNITYQWMGADLKPPHIGNITNVRVAPTRSIFTMQVGPMNITATYLSPIEPSDWVLQSFPFSYVYVDASTLDGQAHDLQIYSHITGEWLSSDLSSPIMWSHQTQDRSIYHEVQLQSPQMDVELGNQRAQDGTAYYATANRDNLTWEINTGLSFNVFPPRGALADTTNTVFAPISPHFMTFAFALDFGRIQTIEERPVWSVGYVRDPSIAYTAPDSSVHQLKPYYLTKYGVDNIGPAIDDFASSFEDALERATALDEALIGNATAVTPHYADLVSLAARQTLSTLDITISLGSDGKPNASDVRIFMKDIGSGSPTGRVNPVERMYAAMPALLYFNASMLGPMLSPLLDAQDGQTGIPYAAQDLGLAYPNATGIRGAHNEAIEQTGNMLILMYAHAKFSGDGSLLYRHYDLAKRWADYLVNNSLTPSNQFSADNEGAANMTNLAIKGIIGVQAMSEISAALGKEADAQQYSGQATALVQKWESYALSSTQSGHLLGVYGDQDTWALMYNLYADRLLGTNLVNQTILQSQTAFYKTLFNPATPFGPPLDNTAVQTSAAWLMFTAATVTDDSVRDSLIESVWNRLFSNKTTGAFPDQYNVQTGAVLGGAAGPAAGGVFSILALSLPTKNITVPSVSGQGLAGGGTGPEPGNSSGHSGTPAGVVAGGVIAGLALVALAALGVWWFMRGKRRRGSSTATSRSDSEATRGTVSPYALRSPETRQTAYNGSEKQREGPGTAAPVLGWASPLSTENQRLSLSVNAGTLSSRPSATPTGSQSVTASSGSSTIGRHTLSEDGTRSVVSPTDVVGLRTEVENLRRVMQEIREERLLPPPEYTG